jgi:hypothetical protein
MKMTMMIIIFCPFPSNGAPVEWNWHGKPEELGEKPVPVSLCPPQIPHGLTWDRTRAFAVGGRRLTAWALARPLRYLFEHVVLKCMYESSLSDIIPRRHVLSRCCRARKLCKSPYVTEIRRWKFTVVASVWWRSHWEAESGHIPGRLRVVNNALLVKCISEQILAAPLMNPGAS